MTLSFLEVSEKWRLRQEKRSTYLGSGMLCARAYAALNMERILSVMQLKPKDRFRLAINHLLPTSSPGPLVPKMGRNHLRKVPLSTAMHYHKQRRCHVSRRL